METGARIGEALNLSVEDIHEGFVVFYTHKSQYGSRIPRKVPYDTSRLKVLSLSASVGKKSRGFWKSISGNLGRSIGTGTIFAIDTLQNYLRTECQFLRL